ncbi:MAG TPA: carbonic anhydrase [Gemmatimonadaceae bacterium]|nr:carbonic anhydrase [Gemmatimonadaceae bacterium]
MALLDELLEANRRAFPRDGDIGTFVANRHLCIVTCVDPRLTRFFPQALGVERGHAVVLRVPGAHLAPGSEGLRALGATIYVNDCQEVLVMGHTDCGAARVRGTELAAAMRARGVPERDVPADPGAFFGLIRDAREAALETARAIRAAPFLPPRLPVHVTEIDVRTGALELLERGD